ncbi:MAG: M3 family oligoendopeptidase [Anaerolineae bacterium]
MTKNALPHWDLSNVYPGLESEEFVEDVGQLKAQLEALDEYLSTHQIAQGGSYPQEAAALGEVIAGYLDRMNDILRLSSTMRTYVHTFVATDSYNQKARRLLSQLEPLLVRTQHQEVRFRGWIGTVAQDEGLFQAALRQEGPVAEHCFYLRETAERSRYMMSEAEEALAAELSLSGSRAWGKLQGTVTSQIKVPFDVGGDGQIEHLPITVVQNMRHDPDEAVRRRAYEVELSAWEQVREPLAASLNGIKGAVNTLNEHRGRVDALHEPLDQARIDRETLEAMLGAMRDSFPAFRGYFRGKARRLGKETLAWWDLFAPTGQSASHFSFGEAQDFIVSQFGTFSDRLAAFAQHAFEARWIDAEPRGGKQGGAFCTSLPAVEESRILCNFDGSLDQVLTVAHELGHAYHNDCYRGKTLLQRRTPMTLAETASIFNETIVTDALLRQAHEPGEKLAILETFLIGASQVIVDIYSRYLFEREVFQRRAGAELSADEFCELMLWAQEETYGDGLDPDHRHPYMWAWKPHYYRAELSFYNFPYAFGLLFGLGLYAVYQERGDAFLADYDQLLRSSGEGRAAELAGRFGIHIRQRAFWQGSLGLIEERIEQYLNL